MVLTPLIDIDNLNLSKIEPLWSLMTKGEVIHKDRWRHKDKEKMTKGRNMKVRGSIKILST